MGQTMDNVDWERTDVEKEWEDTAGSKDGPRTAPVD